MPNDQPNVDRLSAMCAAMRGIAGRLETNDIYCALLQSALEHSEAQRCLLLACNETGHSPIGIAQFQHGSVSVQMDADSARAFLPLPAGVLQHVRATRQTLSIADTSNCKEFNEDVRACERSIKSLICLPLVEHGNVTGLLYLEHGLTPSVFTPERTTILNLFLKHTATALENARQHQRLQQECARLLRVDQDLAFQRNLLRTLVESVPYRIYAKDIESRFTFGNMAVAAGMGASHPDELLGRTDFDFYSEEAAAGYFAEEQVVIRSGAPIIDREENVNYSRTNEAAWMLTNKVPLRNDEGRIIGLVGINYNITERKRMELELMRRNAELEELTAKLAHAQEQLIQSEKLASIGQLAAGVAHEINNPIGYVFCNFHTLSRYLKDLFAMIAAHEAAEQQSDIPAPVKEDLARLRKQIDLPFLKEDVALLISESSEGLARVTKIVQDLKDFSRSGNQEERMPADLHAGIDATLNIIGSEIKPSADVVKIYGDIPQVECIGSQISQVVMNLLMNAVHAIEDAGRGRGTITIRTGAADGKAWIEVGDNGCGIPEEARARLFDPFYTTKRIGKGTGLGLSLAYGILHNHNGSIEVDSEPGKGSTFRLTLPVTPAR